MSSRILTIVLHCSDPEQTNLIFDAMRDGTPIMGATVTGIATGNILNKFHELQDRLPECLCEDCHQVMEGASIEYCECEE